MPSTLDQAALTLCRALAAATAGKPMQWRSLTTIAGQARLRADQVGAAVARGVEKGWLIVEGGHSICLTDAGRNAAG